MVFPQELFRRSALTLALVTQLAAPVQAQQIDPQILRQIQGQAGAAGQNQPSPVDAARDRGTDTQPQIAPGLTPAERDLRERRARVELDRSYQPTPIEREFRERLGDPTLKQFGYDSFAAETRATAPLTGQLGDSYVLGVGDELVVIFQGSTSRSITTRVDREGRLVVDQLRPIPAAGRPLGAVRRDLEQATRSTLLGTDVFLSVGSVRSITVLVSGEVVRPGQYAMTSMADVVAAIGQAGGVRKTGTLRQVIVDRAGGRMTYDLYGLLGAAETRRIQLRDGDRIIVRPVGGAIGVAGGVARPGVFELPSSRGGMTVGQALALAGGPLRPRGNDVVLSRIDANGKELFTSVTALNTPLRAGDGLIVTAREQGAQGRVKLSGFVDNPGVRTLASAPTVSSLLGTLNTVRPGSYLPMAILIRLDPRTRARQYESVNLLDALRDGQDVPLRSDDELVVLSANAIAYLQSDVVRQVALGESLPNLQCAALRGFAQLVRETRSDRFSAVLRGTFVVDRGGRAEVVTDTGVQTGSAGRDVETLRTGRTASAGQPIVVQGRTQDPALLNDPMAEQDIMRDHEEFDRNGCLKVFEAEPGLLPFAIETMAYVGGAVRRPGAYPVARTVSLADLVSVAEGLAQSDRVASVEVSRLAPAMNEPGRQTLDFGSSPMASIRINSGDDARLVATAAPQELGAVLVSGEFLRPGLYTIRKGERLSELIARAGGMTDQSYPYGAVFTRRSVKQAMQEGFRRTSRDLNQALLSRSGRREMSADAIIAASRLAESFATIDAPGRMVVESDPAVLAQRPDLDTVLEAGDAVFVPKRPNFVLALGDVLNPGAQQFVPGKAMTAYVQEAGGLQRSADDDRIFLVLPNGKAQPVKLGGWRRSNAVIPPGSTIVIPKELDPLASLDLVRDISTIIGQFAVSLASIAVLARGN
jgi:polysaccharide biosynthesis/export protein